MRRRHLGFDSVTLTDVGRKIVKNVLPRWCSART